ncbi:hypothetical protein ACCAA_670111 [Candidatus Accumulibacter aalborgensis]|uniref:Uncharacterized protein n=1 Tax=Candidatus Accumulibacter aalborgensis TaxID=1860102 RepID=A0A1A8XYT0_9PROT|nr:hypothetical protein ACCAA_670111 [Candidatus Accumulibacter aalborgensis]
MVAQWDALVARWQPLGFQRGAFGRVNDSGTFYPAVTQPVSRIRCARHHRLHAQLLRRALA